MVLEQEVVGYECLSLDEQSLFEIHIDERGNTVTTAIQHIDLSRMLISHVCA